MKTKILFALTLATVFLLILNFSVFAGGPKEAEKEEIKLTVWINGSDR